MYEVAWHSKMLYDKSISGGGGGRAFIAVAFREVKGITICMALKIIGKTRKKWGAQNRATKGGQCGAPRASRGEILPQNGSKSRILARNIR